MRQKQNLLGGIAYSLYIIIRQQQQQHLDAIQCTMTTYCHFNVH